MSIRLVVYEQLLDRDPTWALAEGSMHFEKQSAVHKALVRIVRRLDDVGVSYALVGGMALFMHGYRRFTEDVDLLVTAEGLAAIHRDLEGRGLSEFANAAETSGLLRPDLNLFVVRHGRG